MAGWLHGIGMRVCWFSLPRRGFSHSLFRKYTLYLLTSHTKGTVRFLCMAGGQCISERSWSVTCTRTREVLAGVAAVI